MTLPAPGPRPRPGANTRVRVVKVAVMRFGLDVDHPKTYEVRARTVATAFSRATAFYLKEHKLRVTPGTTVESTLVESPK